MVEANCNRRVCSRSLQRMSNHARGSLEPGSIMRKLSMTKPMRHSWSTATALTGLAIPC